MAKEEKNVDLIKKEDENNSDWLWKLTRPITYNGEEISELHFNFEKLTGADALEVENELMSTGKLSMYSQVSNVNYIVRIAAKACEKNIGADLFNLVSIPDFNTLRNHVQLFLLRVPS